MIASRNTVALVVVSGVMVFGGALDIVVAGSLEPPAPPAPTMKTLDDVEPRVPIRANQLPYVIVEPGSYYLAEDITTFDSGIYITSDNVTLDLMGHRLAGGSGFGIEALSPVHDVVIRNGTVSGWGVSGIHVAGSRIRIEAIHAIDNTFDGIVVGDHANVYRCTATGNNVGIKIGNHGSIVESIASDNDSYGIDAWEHARITSCTASGNGNIGIRLAHAGIVRDSISTANDSHGISVTLQSYVLNNNCDGNGPGESIGAGIRVEGSDNRIDGNHVIGNDVGISAVGTGNLIIRNSASGNEFQYSIVFPNDLGPISSAITGTSPWANIAF